MGRIKGDLSERTIEFAVALLAIADQLPGGAKGWEIAKQLIRSGTSIGSNVREADNALTDADFAHKCSIARKEASETHYWLDLCSRAGMLSGDSLTTLLQEAHELASVLSTVVMRTQHYIEKHDRKTPAKRR
jgi:four helix bundle protein